MKQIVLDVNLKFLLPLLTIEQRGELITALLESDYTGSDETVKNVWLYIETLQQQREQKSQHMREISAKGVCARLSKLTEKLTVGQPTVNRLLEVKERKEAKENKNNNKKNNLNIFIPENSEIKSTTSPRSGEQFTAPSVEEVSKFIEKSQLLVNAEVFVNFYESHGWMVGKTPISNWRATVKLWHMRAIEEDKKAADIPKISTFSNDETYWHELEQRVSTDKQNQDILSPPKTISAKKNLPVNEPEDMDLDLSTQPFLRFIRRVEKYDM